MPMKYNPDTGIPYYEPLPLGEPLEEGVTPKPVVIDSKSAVFKGDKNLTQEEYEKLRDGVEPIDVVDPNKIDPAAADKMMQDAMHRARPAKLDKDFATDEEVAHLERLCNEHGVLHWPMLLRLINRLKRAEGR